MTMKKEQQWRFRCRLLTPGANLLGLRGLTRLHIQQAICLNRELQRQTCFGVFEIDRGDLGDAFEAILQGVTMNVQRFSSLAQVTVMREESFECLEQVAVLLGVVRRQCAERFIAERDQIGMLGHLEQ